MNENKKEKTKGINMLNKMIKFVVFSILSLNTLSAFQMPNISDKFYINDEEFAATIDGDAFHIHVGDNIWLSTNTVHRDASGLYAYEHNLTKSKHALHQMDYERKWKCPYCYKYWPIGQQCGNPDCPSKYK